LLAEVQAPDAGQAVPVIDRVRRAFHLGGEATEAPPLVRGRIEAT
jgi:hypothetical protein